MNLDFDQRALQSIADGGGLKIFWRKQALQTTINRSHCLFQGAGDPVAGVFGAAALTANLFYSGNTPSQNTGLIGLPTLATGCAWALSKFSAFGNTSVANGHLMLGDLLCAYNTINGNINTLQTMLLSPAGSSVLPRYTDGKGVRLFGLCTVALGATPATLTVIYTNELGTSGKTTTCSVTASTPQSLGINATGKAFEISLAAGDKGIRSIQSAQLSAATGAGSFALLLYKPIEQIYLPGYSTNIHNYAESTPRTREHTPNIMPGAALVFFWQPIAASLAYFNGMIHLVQMVKAR